MDLQALCNGISFLTYTFSLLVTDCLPVEVDFLCLFISFGSYSKYFLANWTSRHPGSLIKLGNPVIRTFLGFWGAELLTDRWIVNESVAYKWVTLPYSRAHHSQVNVLFHSCVFRNLRQILYLPFVHLQLANPESFCRKIWISLWISRFYTCTARFSQQRRNCGKLVVVNPILPYRNWEGILLLP